MAKKIPDDPVKRRLRYFKGIYQHLEHFRSLMEMGAIPLPGIVTTPDGEEVYLADMLCGIDDLPPRQREAFVMICLQGYTETAATKVMLPNSRWSTPVQQYADTALVRMVAAYDRHQAGALAALTEDEEKRRKKAALKKRRESMSKSSPVGRHLQAALDELARIRDKAREHGLDSSIEKVIDEISSAQRLVLKTLSSLR